jgi:hypothetical protein
MENHIELKLIRNKKYYFILFVLVYTCFCCQFTPKGGGDLIVSSSISESKKKGMFKREYKLIPDSVFEYKDGIINIKLVFNDIFIENTHKEMRRIPEYKEKQYYNSGCDTCPEQFVAYFKIDCCDLEYYDYWYIDEFGRSNAKFIYAYSINGEDFIPDTLKLHIFSAYKYREKTGINYKICFDTLTFVKK